MTIKELDKLAKWLEDKVPTFSHDVYNDESGNYNIVPVVRVNELHAALADYPVSEPEPTCAPNYEAMYNDMVAKVESQRAEIKNLKHEKNILEHKLASAKGAIAMVEVIYGRQWKPSYLEMIR